MEVEIYNEPVPVNYVETWTYEILTFSVSIWIFFQEFACCETKMNHKRQTHNWAWTWPFPTPMVLNEDACQSWRQNQYFLSLYKGKKGKNNFEQKETKIQWSCKSILAFNIPTSCSLVCLTLLPQYYFTQLSNSEMFREHFAADFLTH